MDPITLTAIGLGGQALTQGFAGGYALSQGLKMKVDDRTDYTIDPTIRGMRSEAELQQSGRMANAGAMERNAQTSGAVAQDSYNRAATDATQAFMGTAAVNAQNAQSGLNLAQLEAQDQARRDSRADRAGMLLNTERARQIQDDQLKRQEQIAAKTQLISGGLQGITSGFGGLASIGQLQSQFDMQTAQENYYNAAAKSGGFRNNNVNLGGIYQSNSLGTWDPVTQSYV